MRAGRRAEALDHYAMFREHLVDELGEEPCAELQALHLRLLREADVTADTPDVEPAQVKPRQLPAVVHDFVGRQAELRILDEITGATHAAREIVISAIAGTAGIGKTAAAVRWAHSAAGTASQMGSYM